MSELAVDKVDVGVNSTLPRDKVTWAVARNVRFTPGYVSKTLGKALVGTLPTASLNILAMFTFTSFEGQLYTFVCTPAKVYVGMGDLTSFTDITPTVAPTGGVLDFWDFAIVAGLPILTNGKDNMWKWTSPTTILTPMTHGIIAKNINCCMHRLVCSNIVEDGDTYTGRARWSETGNPENFVIDTTKKAGRFDLVTYDDNQEIQHDVYAQVVEGSKVYFFTRQRKVWVSDFSQGTKSFVIIDHDFELISKRSVVARNGIIYAADSRNVYEFNNGKKPIGDPIKKAMSLNICNRGRDYSFAFPMISTNEIWFCMPTGTSPAQPDTAYIYNWELENWTLCDCDFLCHSIYYGGAYVKWINNISAVVAWTNATGDTVQWTTSALVGRSEFALDIAGDSASHVLQMDSGYNALSTALAETAITGRIETGDMFMENRTIEKVVNSLFPDFHYQSQSSTLMIQVGTRKSPSMTISWGPVISFRIGTDDYADLRNYTSVGAYVCLRFYTNVVDSPWALGRYNLNYSEGKAIR